MEPMVKELERLLKNAMVLLTLANLVVTGLVFYVWYDSTGPHDLHPCPKACQCSYPWVTKGAFVNCSRRFLANVPPDLPRDTVQLDLSHNSVRVIPRVALEGLQILDMSCNQLGDRGAALLKDRLVCGLEELKLASNQITKLPLGLPPTLKYLDLCTNLIAGMVCTSVSDLPALTTLKLCKNMISTVTKDSFCPRYGPSPPLANTLRYLDLSKNNMHTMHIGALCCLEALVHLDLSCNRFTAIGIHTFRGNPSIQHLDLSKNSIAQIADGAFMEMKDLVSLNLAKNRLTQAPRNLPGKLQLLDLSNNAITVLHEDATLLSVRHIFVTHNPLFCDCRLAWIKDNLIRAALPDNVKGKCTFPVWTPPDNETALCDLMPRCAKPSSLAGKPLYQVPPDVFMCIQGGQNGHRRSLPTKPSPMPSRRIVRSANSLGNFFNRGISSGKPETDDCECPKMPDEPWLWVNPINDTSLKVEWELPPALEEYSLEVMFYMFGHRECKKIVDVEANEQEFILTNLRPDTNYVVCLVPRHCLEAAGGPILLESCQEVHTLKSTVWNRVVLSLLGGSTCCHRNVAIIILLLALLGLLLMAGHIIRKLWCWWLEFNNSATCKISCCCTKVVAGACSN